jgi:NTE family protein
MASWAASCVALTCCVTVAAAADATPPTAASGQTPHRPKVALVLSGGGARGSAHLGVMQVLERYHVPVDLVVGTSMGSIMGGLYASGWSTEDMDTKLTSIDWGSVFVDKLQREDKSFRRKEDDSRFLIPLKMRFSHWKPYVPPAVIGGQNLQLLFEGLAIEATGETDFDRFPIPYRAVATDLATGRAVVIGSGSLSTAMRASMSLPGILPPVDMNGKALADGGMAANFPIRIAQALGADVIIGVDITSPLHKKEALGNLLTRVDQVTGLLTNANKEDDMAAVRPQDIILVPELGDISFSDFAKAKLTIQRGVDAAEQAQARLKELAVPEAEWEAYMARHHRRSKESLVVTKVVIENTSPLSDAIVDRRIVVPLGKPLDENDLSKQIKRLYGLDVFGPIPHEFERQGDQGTLTVKTPPKPYGRNSLQFGFYVANDFKGDIDVDLTVSHLLLPTNRLGGEWRNTAQLGTNSVVASEYYQPLDPAMAWVFDGGLDFRRNQISIFSDAGDELAQYTFNTFDASTSFGRIFGSWGKLSAGAFYASGNGTVRVGIPAFPNASTDDGGIFTLFVADTLDSITWPRRGWFGTINYRKSYTSMGAQAPGEFAAVRINKPMTFGKNTFLLGAEWNDIIRGPLLIDTAYALGGFLRLSGLREFQLIGARGGLARVAYYRELTSFNLGSMTQRMYAGFSCETGNVYNTGDVVDWPSLRLSGALFVGADTVLGPAYLAYGYGEGHQQSAYLIIGRKF